MTEPLPETESGSFAHSALPILSELLKARDVLAIGPGLGTAPETVTVVRGVIESAAKPMVIDADALNALALQRGSRPRRDVPAILTPHPGEAARLIGTTSAAVQSDRRGAARRIARDFGCCAVLKGDRTLIARPDGMLHVNSTGNPGMATGGSGDALTGIAAAWLAQGLTPFDAATLSVFVHGLAGDLAAGNLGEVSLMAGDIIDTLPAAYLSLPLGPTGSR
jgi:NAD(P)H-hydrate epimerase